MTQIDRRTFLRGAAATAGAAALGGPFAGFAADALAASSKPSFRGLRPTPRRARRRGPTVAPGRLQLSLVPRHGDAGHPRRRDGPARPPRRDGRVRRPERQRHPDPQPRAEQPGRAVRRPVERLRRDGPGGDDDDRGHAPRRGRQLVHEPERDHDGLRRRPDAVGRVDRVRGVGQRAGRRAGLHRRLEHPAPAAARLPVRGPGRRGLRRAADHPRRALLARGRGARPEARDPLRDRGRLPDPVGFLPVPARRPTRWRPAVSTTTAGSRCSR